MACIINASTSNGLVNSADGSGIVKLQSNGVATNALAWVNFNGTGTVAIASSYNVSSITDNGTGNYTVNFATALSDANFVVNVTTNSTTGDSNRPVVGCRTGAATTSTTVQTVGVWNNNTNVDCSVVSVSVFGN